jgi:hypothetical protein
MRSRNRNMRGALQFAQCIRSSFSSVTILILSEAKPFDQYYRCHQGNAFDTRRPCRGDTSVEGPPYGNAMLARLNTTP